MVTPGQLQEKVSIEQNYLEQKNEQMRTALENTIDARAKEVLDKC